MGLRLVVGKANVGKTGTAFDLVRQAHADGRDPVLVLPSQPDVRRAADELSSIDPLGFRVMTFDAYLDEAWAKCGDGRSILSGSERRLLAFAAARRAGAGSGMGELATACVTVLAGQAGEEWRASRPHVAGAGERLARTIIEYGNALQRLGLVEPEEAAHAIAQDPSMPGSPLVAHRFIDFTPWQEVLLGGAGRVREALVTLTWEPGFAPTKALDGLVERLAADTETAAGDVFHTRPELVALADGLYADPTPLSSAGFVRFSLAEGYEAEAHRIAEEVRLVMEEYDKTDAETSVAVVFRQPERHHRFLREAFNEAGIEADFDVRQPLDSTPFGATVLALLQFAVSGDRDSLLAVLKSPFSGVERGAALELERSWRHAGIFGRAELVDGLWRLSRELQALTRSVEKASRSAFDADGAKCLARAISGLMVTGTGRSGETDAIAAEDAAAHAAIQRVLVNVASADDGEIVLSDVIEVLRRTIVTMQAPDRQGVVQVMAADRIRGRRYDTVIIGGMNSDEFPAAPSESMQQGSVVADVIESFGGKALPPKGIEYEQLLFYTVLTRAQRKVVVSARTADSDGDPAAVSSIFEAVADFFRDTGVEDSRPPFEFRALSQTPRAVETATPRERLRAAAQMRERDARSLAAAWRSQSRAAQLKTEEAIGLLTEVDSYSPSAIDTYLECPYRWFYSRAIGAETLESEFDAREQGSLAHAVLAASYTELIEGGMPRVSPDTVELAKETIRTHWDRVVAGMGEARTVLERSQRRATLEWACRIIEDDATFAPGFYPTRMEWAFGLAGQEPIDLDGFKLRGRVDRIDTDVSGRAVVIDYKRSSGPTAANILEKRKIQVPLYLEAIRRGLHLTPVAGIYRGLQKRCDRGLLLGEAEIDGPFTRTDVRGQAEFDNIIEASLDLAREAVAGMREGRIDQRPFDRSICKACSARPVCGGAR